MINSYLLVLKEKKKEITFFLLFILTSLPFFIKLTETNQIKLPKKESYEEKLFFLASSKSIIKYTDSVCTTFNALNKLDTAKFVDVLGEIMKFRFKHGLTNYSFSDNWIAYLAGKLFWNHFSAIVNPDDILKYKEGLCSQQTIVFMDVLKRKGIQTRSVGLGKEEGPGHFLCEVLYNNEWHLYDVSLEPNWSGIYNPHQSMDYYLKHKDSLFVAYKSRMSLDLFDNLITKVKYGKIDEFPARNMLIFHKLTYYITILLPCLFFVLLNYSIYKKRKSKKVNL